MRCYIVIFCGCHFYVEMVIQMCIIYCTDCFILWVSSAVMVLHLFLEVWEFVFVVVFCVIFFFFFLFFVLFWWTSFTIHSHSNRGRSWAAEKQSTSSFVSHDIAVITILDQNTWAVKNISSLCVYVYIYGWNKVVSVLLMSTWCEWGLEMPKDKQMYKYCSLFSCLKHLFLWPCITCQR